MFCETEVLQTGRLAQIEQVLPSMKQLALIVELETDQGLIKGLYRPETGVKLSLDSRIPKPEELYRDVAYHQVDKMLGWDVSLPVVEWALNDGDHGVLRPYFDNVETMEIYHYKKGELLKNKYFWTRVAVLDYICGVVDRTYNDILIINQQHWVIDSGLSFVNGKDFLCQNCLVRDVLKGVELNSEILEDLKSIRWHDLTQNVMGLVPDESIGWLIERARKIIDVGKVI